MSQLHYAQIENGAVVNTIVFDGPMPDDWPDRSSWHQHATAQIGWLYSDGTFTPPVLPVVSLPENLSMSKRQFVTLLGLEGIITYAESLAWLSSGVLPQVLVDVLDTIPDPQTRFLAEADLTGAIQFERDHNMVPFVAYALSTPEREYTSDALDALWRRGVQL